MITIDNLLERQISLLPGDETKLLFPDYGGYNLVNLPWSICSWLGLEITGKQGLGNAYPLDGEKYDRVILILMDGLGWHRLQNWICNDTDGCMTVWKDLIAGKCLMPLTSISPSTTCAALTTLNTGEPPITHGNLAYELWLQEYNAVYNMILQSSMPYRDNQGEQASNLLFPKNFLPVATIDAHIIKHGGAVTALHPASIAHSSLTRTLFPLASRGGYHSMGDLFYQIKNHARANTDIPSYLYVYWSEIDELSHVYGPNDPRVRVALCDFSRYLGDLKESLSLDSNGKTLVIVTADHGLQSTPIREEYDLSRHPSFLDNLEVWPTGENRLAFLHIKKGRAGKVRKYIESEWPGKFRVYDTSDVFATGLMGTGIVYEESPRRMGDLLIVALDEAYLWWSTRDDRLLGRHGSLSQHEMLVPLALIPFG